MQQQQKAINPSFQLVASNWQPIPVPIDTTFSGCSTNLEQGHEQWGMVPF